MNPKIKFKWKRNVRSLVERAILVARMPPNITNTPRDDLLATIHLLEVQQASFKVEKIADFGISQEVQKIKGIISRSNKEHRFII